MGTVFLFLFSGAGLFHIADTPPVALILPAMNGH